MRILTVFFSLSLLILTSCASTGARTAGSDAGSLATKRLPAGEGAKESRCKLASLSVGSKHYADMELVNGSEGDFLPVIASFKDCSSAEKLDKATLEMNWLPTSLDSKRAFYAGVIFNSLLSALNSNRSIEIIWSGPRGGVFENQIQGISLAAP